jgi:sulfite exporter TauE/SafE
MSESLKSLIRHILTALGTILGLIGLNEVVPVLTFLQDNLDVVNNAVLTILGFVTALAGFFKDKSRFETKP